MAEKKKPKLPLSTDVRAYLAQIGSRGGRIGGPIGGRRRAEKLGPRRRREIARQAALARWRRKRREEA